MKMNKENIEILSAQLVLLGDFLAVIVPTEDSTDLVDFANLIIVIADLLILQSVLTNNNDMSDTGNKLTALGDVLIAFSPQQ